MKTDILYVLGRIAFRISARVWKQFLLQGHPKAPIPKQYFIPTSAKKCPSAGGFSLPDPPQAPSQKKNVVRKPPSCTMHRALRSVPASSESNAAQNNEELRRSAAAVAAQGGVYPPLEPIRAVAAGGGRPPPGL